MKSPFKNKKLTESKQNKRAMVKPQDISVPLRESTVGGETEDVGWRNLTSQANRNLAEVTQKRMQEIAFYLYDSNPMAHRIIEIGKDFVAGDGFRFQAAEPVVQDLLQDFWDDPDNSMDIKMESKIMELSLWGEQCYPVFVNKVNGHVKLGYLDPGLIQSVRLDPQNPERIKEIKWLKGQKVESWKVINSDQRKTGKSSGMMVGDCFYFAINKVVYASRGRSDLLPLCDWIDGYDQFLFARLERAFYLNNFIWDVLCEGMSEKEIKEFANNLKPPAPGSARVHNEKVKWDMISTKLEAADASAEAALFKNQILGGAGYPEHWFGIGEKTTRACYSEDTETLTENGWKKYWEIKKDEKIATFNPKKDRVEFHIPKAFYLYDYKGEMYHFKNTRTDILVTPEHRMWIRPRQSNKWQIIQAKDIKYKDFYIREGVKNWKGTNPKYFDLPYIAYDAQSRKKDAPHKIAMKDWVNFLGWYLSEGYLNKTKNQFCVRIAQKDKNNIIKIKKMLVNLGFTFTECDNGQGCTVFNINNKSLWHYLKENAGSVSGEKRIPKGILQLDKDLLIILFKAMMDGDGRYDKRKGRNCFSYTTKSKQLADDFQILCLLIGFSTRVGIAKKDEFRWFEISGSKTIERHLKAKDMVNNKDVFYKSNLQKEQYNGKVYCFSMPHQFMVTRRNSLIAIQLNTAQEMGLPTLKKLRSRQRYIKHMVTYIFNFVIDQAILHGSLPKNINKKFVVLPAPIITKDARGLAITLDKFATAMETAVDKGWIVEDTARTSFRTFMTDLGIELHQLETLKDYSAEYEKAKDNANANANTKGVQNNEQNKKQIPNEKKGGKDEIKN